MTLRNFSLVVVVSALILIAAGGLVTSHEAGLAVPDWPLSYGRFFPPMVGNIFWEHGHRMIAGTVGILTLVLTLWVQFKEKRRWVRRLAWTAFLTVCLQAILGGLTVIFLLPPAISIFHACLGQTFFCLVVGLAYFLNTRKPPPPSERVQALHPSLVFAAALIYVQLILGAVIRHTNWVAAPHIFLAFVIAFAVARIILRTEEARSRRIRTRAVTLGALVIIQILLGFGAFIFTRIVARGYEPNLSEVFFASAHQTVGALVLATAFLMSLMTSR